MPRLPEALLKFSDDRQFICPGHDGMYASVLCNGMWEPLETRALLELLRVGDFAIDVGANHGWHTIGMATVVGDSGAVWAVEPVPEVGDAWRRNLARNPRLKASLFDCALAAEPGDVTLHVFRGLPEGHASLSTLGRDDYASHQEIPARTLDDLITEATRVPALVKIDVEGADLGVLQGAIRLAKHPCPPMWLLEVNHDVSAQFGYKPSALLERLTSAGPYQVYRLTPGGPVPECEPDSAPHGAAWLVVPPAYQHRLEAFDRMSQRRLHECVGGRLGQVARLAASTAVPHAAASSVSRRVRTIAVRTLQLAGFEVKRYRPVAARRQSLFSAYQIDTVLDVGAHTGKYGSELRAFGYRGTIESFEPNPAAFAQLHALTSADSAWTCHQIALGDCNGMAELNVTTKAASSSLRPISDAFTEIDPGARIERQIPVAVTPLDDLGLALPAGRTYLKLDVQGFEDAVLRGAVEALKSVSLVECELSLRPMYEGQPSMAAMLEQLLAAGFSLAVLSPGYRDPRHGDIIEFDGIFECLSSVE